MRELKAKQVNENVCVVVGKVCGIYANAFLWTSYLFLWSLGETLPTNERKEFTSMGDNTKSISSGHCTCMAGLWEVCSHVAAILFAQHARTNMEDEPACTDKLAMWPVPKVTSVEMIRIRDMGWCRSSTSNKPQNISALKGEELTDYLKSIQATGCTPVINRIVPN